MPVTTNIVIIEPKAVFIDRSGAQPLAESSEPDHGRPRNAEMMHVLGGVVGTVIVWLWSGFVFLIAMVWRLAAWPFIRETSCVIAVGIGCTLGQGLVHLARRAARNSLLITAGAEALAAAARLLPSRTVSATSTSTALAGRRHDA